MYLTELEILHTSLRAAAQAAANASQKFVGKVQRGEARSVETYDDLQTVLRLLKTAGVTPT